MNKEIEKEFIKKFVEKQKRERCLFELFSIKKRGEGIRQLSNKLIKNNIIPHGNTDKEIRETIEKYFNLFDQKVYIISDMEDIDGTVQYFEKAFNEVMCGSGTYIIVCGADTIFLKDEDPGVGGGLPSKYILHNKLV